MRRFVVCVLSLGFSFVASKNLGDNYHGLLTTRSLNADFDIDYVFYYLKGNKDQSECEKKLDEHCDLLKSFNSGFRDPCFNKKETCQKLVDNKTLESKCKQLKELKNDSSEDCDNILMKCFFLEGACSDVTSKCNEVRSACYKKRHKRFADTLFLRLVHDDLSDASKCESTIKSHCPSLAGRSPGLLAGCLDVKKTCEGLKSVATEICTSLKASIDNVNKNEDLLSGKCLRLLEKCHFHSSGCSGTDGLDSLCQKLQQSCGDLGVRGLYDEAQEDGLEFITGFSFLNTSFFFALLIQDVNGATVEERCKEALKQKCPFSHLSKSYDELCKDENDKGDRCRELEKNLSLIVKNLNNEFNSSKLTKNGRNNGNKDSHIPWTSLPELSRSRCNFFLTPCLNARLACFKRERDNFNRIFLKKNLQGFLDSSNDYVDSCASRLNNRCRVLKLYAGEMLESCLDSKKTCEGLVEFLKEKCKVTFQTIDAHLDLPGADDCDSLVPLCNKLTPFCFFLTHRCHTFITHCNQFRRSLELRNELLSEGGDPIKSVDACVRRLDGRCQDVANQCNFTYIDQCRSKERSCKILVPSIWTSCFRFLDNIKRSGILENSHTINRDECSFWAPYCDILVGSCSDGLRSPCSKLNEKCKEFSKLEALEEALYNSLGKFKDKNGCIAQLNKYCEDPKNSTLGALCNKDNEYTREKLCGRFVDRLVKQCSSLLPELKKINASLTKGLSLLSDNSLLRGTVFIIELSAKVKTHCDRLRGHCTIFDNCDNIKEPCKQIEGLCEKFKQFGSSSGLTVTVTTTTTTTTTTASISTSISTSTYTFTISKTVKQTLKKTVTVTASKSPTTTLGNAGVHLNSLSKWSVLCFSVIISMFLFS
ncbi:hypothetical protein MERGE_000628 [Pneumocystis wakefieldiae]|uniref:Major surface glycoprotein 2 C-terminal domain-containing protein n=1 Tax=Pneumocystis wakefieldiae TaxID=38082 RepID=A0A899G243_9ASCO|nr:hypothetical protein MERGE_000628 [Pneumocystis wakefieldiae]